MENAIVPIKEINEVARVMSNAKLFGKDEVQLAALMLIAHSEGKHLATAALEYDVIQGKPSLNSRAAHSRFLAAGGSICFKKSDDVECIAEFTHPQGGTLTVKWDFNRANKAGLGSKDMWKKYPAQMLRARTVAEGVRAVYPACLSQLYISEELQDEDTTPPLRTTPVETTFTEDKSSKRKKTEVKAEVKPEAVQIVAEVITPVPDPEPEVPQLQAPDGVLDANFFGDDE